MNDADISRALSIVMDTERDRFADDRARGEFIRASLRWESLDDVPVEWHAALLAAHAVWVVEHQSAT